MGGRHKSTRIYPAAAVINNVETSLDPTTVYYDVYEYDYVYGRVLQYREMPHAGADLGGGGAPGVQSHNDKGGGGLFSSRSFSTDC